jgi:hypothetical protein
MKKFKYLIIQHSNDRLVIHRRNDNKIHNWSYDIMLEDAIIDFAERYFLLTISGTRFFTCTVYRDKKVSQEFLETLEVTQDDYYKKVTTFFGTQIILKKGIYSLKKKEPFQLQTNGTYELYE